QDSGFRVQVGSGGEWDRVYERRTGTSDKNPKSQISNLGSETAEPRPLNPEPFAWLQSETGCCPYAADQALRYVAARKAAVDRVPTGEDVVFERFFDESGGMQLVIHAPLGARI